MAIGSFAPNNKQVELYLTVYMTWFAVDEYPYADKYLYLTPILYHIDSFFVFAGYDDNGTESKVIGRFYVPTRTWSKAGELKTGRYGHGAIFDGYKFIVAGGFGTLSTESCIVDGGYVTCSEGSPQLINYYYYPEMYLVETASFCTTNIELQ